MTLRTTTRRACATILFVAAGTALASCGDDSSSSKAKGPVTTIDNVSITNAKDLKVKPGIDIADVLPGTTLIKKDIVVGTGATVKTGDSLTARYVGVAWGSNEQFDASWDRKGQEEIPFTLAKGSVIDGWTEGLPGMKVGGRRLLIVPPAKGYGDQGQGTSIPGGETLVFIVDAKKTEKAPKADPAAAAGGGATSQVDQEALQQALQEAGAGGAQVQTAP